jgi:hypothetical protein
MYPDYPARLSIEAEYPAKRGIPGDNQSALMPFLGIPTVMEGRNSMKNFGWMFAIMAIALVGVSGCRTSFSTSDCGCGSSISTVSGKVTAAEPPLAQPITPVAK